MCLALAVWNTSINHTGSSCRSPPSQNASDIKHSSVPQFGGDKVAVVERRYRLLLIHLRAACNSTAQFPCEKEMGVVTSGRDGREVLGIKALRKE